MVALEDGMAAKDGLPAASPLDADEVDMVSAGFGFGALVVLPVTLPPLPPAFLDRNCASHS